MVDWKERMERLQGRWLGQPSDSLHKQPHLSIRQTKRTSQLLKLGIRCKLSLSNRLPSFLVSAPFSIQILQDLTAFLSLHVLLSAPSLDRNFHKPRVQARKREPDVS